MRSDTTGMRALMSQRAIEAARAAAGTAGTPTLVAKITPTTTPATTAANQRTEVVFLMAQDLPLRCVGRSGVARAGCEPLADIAYPHTSG